ncbi:MAG: endolytic transglycosylase MltG [Bacteroidaceae bacterium]|nr:endolytic transglycosylase MltG [Bacteroidaceae bacterium]
MQHPYIKLFKKHSTPMTIAHAVFFVVVFLLASLFIKIRTKVNTGDAAISVYIDKDDTQDSVRAKVGNPNGWGILHWYFDASPRTGHYLIESKERVLSVYRKLRNGAQTPVKLTIPQVRTMDMMATYLSRHLMLDSAAVVDSFRSEEFCLKYGYTTQTLPALFIANTYEIWWNTSLDNFMLRMQKENERFWNPTRHKKALDMNFTHEQVITLASIVAEETSYIPEMPRVAGMYVRRLQIGMPLQADPTVKFAVGDFSLRRIYHHHLKTPSPYNTYLNRGLPPGPIRVPSVRTIDAVLNHEKHNYLYMCAKEDFSGSHNFARSYSEHLSNARRYVNALNKRKIK